MSTDRYFDKFPIITYNGVRSVDITRRVVPLRQLVKTPNAVYPYELSSYERADQLSNRYYDDSHKAWMLYLSNNILDPYYEWYLQEDEFHEFIKGKYGSIIDAEEKVKFYRNAWYNSDELPESGYNALTPCLQKYWTPKYGVNGRIISYERRELDWQVNTNRVMVYTAANTAGFLNDEIVDVVFDPSNTGRGQVTMTTSSKVFIQHTSGTTETSNTVSITGSSYLYGRTSGANTVFTTEDVKIQNIAPAEEVYWEPVTYYEYETERNEFNKTLVVLDSRYAGQMVEELTTLMDD